MRAEDFSFRLDAASFRAWRFASSMVKQKLPSKFSYGVTLNASHDHNRKDDEMIFPNDDFEIIFDLSQEDVVSLLCREERVPQWIDISVSSCDRRQTYLHLICCGRYHSDDDRLYYFDRGSQPFGIKSPTFPRGFRSEDLQAGRKFNLPSEKTFRDLELLRRDQNRQAQQGAAPDG